MSKHKGRVDSRTKRSRRFSALVFIFSIGVIITGATLVFNTVEIKAQKPITSFSNPNAMPVGPEKTDSMDVFTMDNSTIFIPEINSYAPIISVGTKNNELTVPGDPKIVGRDQLTAPFDSTEGSTVLANHVQVRGTEGAFHDLGKLYSGARIFIKDGEGKITEWVVTSLEASKNKVMKEEYFQTTGERKLTLITCSGPIVKNSNGTRSFRDSIIITAKPVVNEARIVNTELTTEEQ